MMREILKKPALRLKRADVLRYAFWVNSATAMGSNLVVPPPAAAEWMQKWSKLDLNGIAPYSCPNIYPEFNARTAALYKMHYVSGQMPKVDFLPHFSDQALQNIAYCIDQVELPACQIDDGMWQLGRLIPPDGIPEEYDIVWVKQRGPQCELTDRTLEGTACSRPTGPPSSAPLRTTESTIRSGLCTDG